MLVLKFLPSDETALFPAFTMKGCIYGCTYFLFFWLQGQLFFFESFRVDERRFFLFLCDYLATMGRRGAGAASHSLAGMNNEPLKIESWIQFWMVVKGERVLLHVEHWFYRILTSRSLGRYFLVRTFATQHHASSDNDFHSPELFLRRPRG